MTHLGNRRPAWHGLVALASAICMALGLAACGPSGDNEQSKAATGRGPITVVASINQWGSLARRIGGKDVHVTSIVHSVSVDAHDFEPRTSDIAAIQKAAIVVTNGAGYDSWATKSIVRSSIRVDAADAVGAGEGDNAHLWFSKDARRAMATELADAFAKARPGKAKAFQSRLKAWRADEGRLDRRMADFSKRHRHASYGATEAVAYYLMADMGLDDRTPEGYARAVNSEGEPAPGDLRDFQNLIAKRGIDLLIDNVQESNGTTTLLVDSAKQGKVPVVDVTEQMPEGQRDLTVWVGSLADAVSRAAGKA
ncbi:zinc ABC transporter substrate-binding protein [Bifidobacterium sp. ESL0763]|uniref:metal ABC transporter solute-binding protein, Zn/Mn family n=1 Tax=Bifidobacterium sp. ESL0763 TaxID=2983227 RepID=UPI0023F7E847|nr:zinc ABC transporter substrate-binding protein [Bifidobacterium sp. ESL0763]MDF7663971.1 zinc ABC transporter substrate-binding protein [Bifidobacterium sp. ESL0763]